MSSLLDIANLELTPANGTTTSSSSPQNAILTRQKAQLLNGVHTEVFVQSFADRVFIIVTQLGRIGSLLQVNPPLAGIPPPLAPHQSSALANDLPPLPKPDPSMMVTSVFGAAPSARQARLYELYALEVAAVVFDTAQRAGEREQRPVLLGIALKLSSQPESRQGADGYPDEEEDAFGISQTERDTFNQSMRMLQECLRPEQVA